MKTFEFKSGTVVTITDTKMTIQRTDGKSAMKGLFAGRALGQMIIKVSSITGVITYADYLLICASGLPSPSDFKITSIAEIKQYPNCIVAKENELQDLYEYLNQIIK